MTAENIMPNNLGPQQGNIAFAGNPSQGVGMRTEPNIPDTSEEAPDTLSVSIAGQKPFIVHARNNVSFSNQNANEKVYLLVRKHWLTNLGWILRHIIYALIPLIIYLLLIAFKIDTSLIGWKAYLLVILIYYSFLFSNVIRLFSEWYLNPAIITNERVVAYNFKTFGQFNITDLFLENVDDLKQKDSGLLGQFFGYGTICLYGEGEHTQIFLNDIPNPTLVRGVLTDLFEGAKLKYGKH